MPRALDDENFLEKKRLQALATRSKGKAQPKKKKKAKTVDARNELAAVHKDLQEVQRDPATIRRRQRDLIHELGLVYVRRADLFVRRIAATPGRGYSAGDESRRRRG